MGCCGSVDVPDEIIPDPTGPSKFFFKKVSVFSSNYKVLQNDENGKLWLFLRKNGNWFSDNAYFILENFVRGGGPKKDDGQVLAVCKFEKLAGAFKQYGFKTHEDSDGSDGYSFDSISDNEEEYKQKCKWTFKTSSKFYLDRDRTQEVYKLTAKGKGKAKREVKFETFTDAEGKESARAFVTQSVKVKKMVYHLHPTGSELEIPITIVGSLNKSANHLTWESPLFQAEISKGFAGEKAIITTREGAPAMNALIAYIVSVELSPDDVRDKASLTWPRVYGPHGASA